MTADGNQDYGQYPARNEGDLLFETFTTEADAIRRLDTAFLFHADRSILVAHWPGFLQDGLNLDDIPERFRGPFSWDRLNTAQASEAYFEGV